MENKGRALVLTKSDVLYKLVELELYPDIDCDMGCELTDGYDYIIYDYDDSDFRSTQGIGIGFSSGADISLPFPIGRLRDMLLSPCAMLSLDKEKLCATLDGRIIKLTELEAALLDLLIKGGREYTSREELQRAVWGERATDGALNVYIHYLRRKLEVSGERVILSSRSGYKISERYL